MSPASPALRLSPADVDVAADEEDKEEEVSRTCIAPVWANGANADADLACDSCEDSEYSCPLWEEKEEKENSAEPSFVLDPSGEESPSEEENEKNTRIQGLIPVD